MPFFESLRPGGLSSGWLRGPRARATSAALAVAVLAPGCRPSEPPPAATRVVAWQVAGSWSGTGNVQTTTFTSDTGAFRVRWAARNETAPGRGRLKVQFRSGDSGRVIMEPVDQHGVGSGSVETADHVLRWYYLTIEAEHLEWDVAVDEPVMGYTVPRTDR